MQNDKVPKRDPKALAIADAMLIVAPLFLFLFVLALNGSRDSILQKAEWSFVTIFLLIEVLRDQIKRQYLENYHPDQAESGIILYSLLLTVGAIFLYADFENSISPNITNINAFYTVKFLLFTVSVIFFLTHRYRKYKNQFARETPSTGEQSTSGQGVSSRQQESS